VHRSTQSFFLLVCSPSSRLEVHRMQDKSEQSLDLPFGPILRRILLVSGEAKQTSWRQR
jgi:hypothetical protein